MSIDHSNGGGGIRSCARQLWAFFVLPNALYWVLRCYALRIPGHGLFDIAYLLIGAAALYWRRPVVLALLVIAVSADLCDTIAAAYHLRNTGLASVARFVLFPSHIFMATSTVLLVAWICALVALMWRFRLSQNDQNRRIAALVCVAFAIGLIAANSLSGYGVIVNHRWSVNNLRIIPELVRAPEAEIAHDFYIAPARGHGYGTPIPSATEAALPVIQQAWSAGQSPNVVLILVESWGLAHDPNLVSNLSAPYSDPSLLARYNVMRGTTAFLGMTVDGETRELCHSDLGLDVLQASGEQLKGCLPHQFEAHGYQTNGVHGFYREMFERGQWYPRVGIDHLWLRRSLTREGLRYCNFGGFEGNCDYDIAPWIARRILSDRTHPQFVHWVTLNSHMPAPLHLEDREFTAPCDIAAMTNNSRKACSWYRILRRTHEAIRDAALDPKIADTIFIVVGDHMPPFEDGELRAGFSDDEVPYVVLVPKTMTAAVLAAQRAKAAAASVAQRSAPAKPKPVQVALAPVGGPARRGTQVRR